MAVTRAGRSPTCRKQSVGAKRGRFLCLGVRYEHEPNDFARLGPCENRNSSTFTVCSSNSRSLWSIRAWSRRRSGASTTRSISTRIPSTHRRGVTRRRSCFWVPSSEQHSNSRQEDGPRHRSSDHHWGGGFRLVSRTAPRPRARGRPNLPLRALSHPLSRPPCSVVRRRPFVVELRRRSHAIRLPPAVTDPSRAVPTPVTRILGPGRSPAAGSLLVAHYERLCLFGTKIRE